MSSAYTVEQMAKEYGREYAYEVTRTTKMANGRKRTDRWWVITDKGHALLGEQLRALGKDARERGLADWVQPPSSGKERTWSADH